MEFFPEFPYSKTFSRNMNKFNNFLNIIVQGADKLLIIWMFFSAVFKTSSAVYCFPTLTGTLLSVFENISPSSLLSNNPTFIKTSECMFWDALTLDFLGQVTLPLEFGIFLCFKKSCLSFIFSWIKSSRVLVLLIFSGGDFVGTFLLDPHLTQYLSFSLSSPPHEGQKSVTRFPSSWIDLISFSFVLYVHEYIKNRNFWKYRSGFLEWNQGF